MPRSYNEIGANVHRSTHFRVIVCTIGDMTVVERAERKVALLRRAVDLVERIHAIETERDRLLDERDGNCRELRAAGASIKELQDVHGMSRSRVQQILRGPSADH